MASNIIKARTLQTTGQPVIVRRSVQKALREADEILAEARLQAEEIAAEARRKSAEMLSSAHEEGFAKGESRWFETLNAAWKTRDEYLAANEQALLKLAVRIAERLVGEELVLAPEQIVSIVREALRGVRRAKTFVLQAHPADAALLDKRLAAGQAGGSFPEGLEIAPNRALARGDCIIETDIGSIDARLETQLKNIEQALIARRGA